MKNFQKDYLKTRFKLVVTGKWKSYSDDIVYLNLPEYRFFVQLRRFVCLVS